MINPKLGLVKQIPEIPKLNVLPMPKRPASIGLYTARLPAWNKILQVLEVCSPWPLITTWITRRVFSSGAAEDRRQTDEHAAGDIVDRYRFLRI